MKSFQIMMAAVGLMSVSSAGVWAASPSPPTNGDSSAPAPLVPSGGQRSPASVGVGSTISDQEFKVTGQSRNLSMGLLFNKDKATVSFGSARTNYKDKISKDSGF